VKPNIIIVMTDQQRADLRKSRGYPLDTMPFLDSWGNTGVDFDCAYTPNPTCIAARVSMFTGRYPEAHKVRTNHNAADAVYSKDLLELLSEQGYKTAICGKNHTHHSPGDFDFYRLNGHLGNEDGEDKTPEEIAFGEYLSATSHMETHEPSPGGIEVQHPYRNVSDAFEFIDSIKEKDPFFLWVSFAEPHNPYQVPMPYYDMFPPEALPPISTSNIDLSSKGHRYPWIRKMWEKVLGDDIEKRILRSRSNYLGMMRLIDDQFKRLIDGLEERGVYDDTLIVFLSDHGDFAGEYGLIRKGPDLPDVLSKIPMLWHGPDIATAGIKNDVFVNTVDIFPTICDYLGLETPFGCQGKSLLPILKGGEIPADEFTAAYSESGYSGLYWTQEDGLAPSVEGALNDVCTFDELNTWTQCGQVRMVRQGDYKVQIDMMGNGYLYNLKTDPFETINLWDDEAHLDSKAHMLAVLAMMMLRACDPLPAPRNRYRTKVHPKGYWDPGYISDDPGIR